MIILICGESRSGKNAIASSLEDHGFRQLVTTTSRPIRDGEINMIDYNFVTREQFEDLIKSDMLIEYRKYDTLVGGVPDTWYYGSTKERLLDHDNYCIVLTPEGISHFIEYYGKDSCFVVKINVDAEIRKSRAMLRGSFDETEWNRRLSADAEDFSEDKLGMVDLVVDNSGKLDSCVNLIIRKFNKHYKKING